MGTWGPSQRRPCTGSAWPGQLCVPGGAHWLPHPFVAPSQATASLVYDEQLIALSPFYIDATETTVGAVLRSGWLDDGSAVITWSGDEEGPEVGFRDWAPFSGHRERLDLPVTAANAGWQRFFCLSRGGDLPSEAQIVALMGGLTSATHPWGDEIACEDAWVNRVQLYENEQWGEAVFLRLDCASPTGGFEAVRPVGSSGRDRVEVREGSVEDVAGNVAELTRDRFTSNLAPCWGDGWQQDPECPAPFEAGTSLVARGGSLATRFDHLVYTRTSVDLDSYPRLIGFRCTRPGDDRQPPPVERDLVLGQGCHVPGDCGPSSDARCITPEDTDSFPFGGIVGGYCSRSCATDVACGQEGACVEGYCLLRCEAREPEAEHHGSPRVATKCHGRHDLVCSDDFFYDSGEQLCLGSCASDASCGVGRYCDRRLGGCVQTPPSGSDSGSLCEAHDDCNGWCVAGICGDACSAGDELDNDQCGVGTGVCLMSGLYSSPGSLGYCNSACEAHIDCATPEVHCMPYAWNGTPAPWWKVPPHVCFPAQTCGGEGSACGSPGLNLRCLDTPNGLRCLDPAIPWAP